MNKKTLFLIISGILSICSFVLTWYKEWNWLYFVITTGALVLFNIIYYLLTKNKKPQKEISLIETEEDLGASIEECMYLIKNEFEGDYNNNQYHTDLIITSRIPLIKGKESAKKTPLLPIIAKDKYRNIWYKIIVRRLDREIGIIPFKTEEDAINDKTEELMATSPRERSTVKRKFKDEEGKEVVETITPEPEEEKEEFE